MTPPYSVHTAPADTTHAKASAAKRLRCVLGMFNSLEVKVLPQPDGGDCVKKTRNRHAVRKMKVDPSEPPCRRGFQTAISCFGPKTAVVNVMVKRRDRDHVKCG